MYTTNAIITDVISSQSKVWIQLKSENRYFPWNHEFNLSLAKDYLDLESLMSFTGVNKVADLLHKDVRVIDTEDNHDSLVAIGSISKNKFIALKLDMFPTSERKIYRKYRSRR